MKSYLRENIISIACVLVIICCLAGIFDTYNGIEKNKHTHASSASDAKTRDTEQGNLRWRNHDEEWGIRGGAQYYVDLDEPKEAFSPANNLNGARNEFGDYPVKASPFRETSDYGSLYIGDTEYYSLDNKSLLSLEDELGTSRINTLYSDGTSSMSRYSGNNIYTSFSDGSTATSRRVGNNLYTNYDNGLNSSSRMVGNSAYTNFSDGTAATSRVVGNTIYTTFSDGTSMTSRRIGGQIYTDLCP